MSYLWSQWNRECSFLICNEMWQQNCGCLFLPYLSLKSVAEHRYRSCKTYRRMPAFTRFTVNGRTMFIIQLFLTPVFRLNIPHTSQFLQNFIWVWTWRNVNVSPFFSSSSSKQAITITREINIVLKNFHKEQVCGRIMTQLRRNIAGCLLRILANAENVEFVQWARNETENTFS